MYQKSIQYDRETRDYACYLDGELMGFERTYRAAEVYLDQLVFELMSGLHALPTIVEEAQTDTPTTCVFCGGLHHPQHCTEKNALLFAPDAPVCECGGCDNDPDTHYGNLEEQEARRLDDLEAVRELSGLIYPPLDVDFAPIGPEV